LQSKHDKCKISAGAFVIGAKACHIFLVAPFPDVSLIDCLVDQISKFTTHAATAMNTEASYAQAYCIGFSLPYRSILEMLIRLSVPCGAFRQVESDEELMNIMWVLCDVSSNNVTLLETALTAMARKRVFVITHNDLGGYPRHRAAFLAQCTLHIPEACAIHDLPKRSFLPEDMAGMRRLLGVESVTDEFIMRRWDDRELDPDPAAETRDPPRTAPPLQRRQSGAKLPLELVDAVLSVLRVPALDDDGPLWWIPSCGRVAASLEDLHAASTVCRAWLPLARRHALATVPLYLSTRRANALIDLLRNPTWRALVQRVYICFPFRSERLNDDAAVLLINAILRPISHIQALHFDNVPVSFVVSGPQRLGTYTRISLPNDLQSFGFRVIGCRSCLNSTHSACLGYI